MWRSVHHGEAHAQHGTAAVDVDLWGLRSAQGRTRPVRVALRPRGPHLRVSGARGHDLAGLYVGSPAVPHRRLRRAPRGGLRARGRAAENPMNLFLLLFGLFVMPGPVITDAGYCPDVMSAACPVRDYYPRNLRITAVGQDVYYFVDAQPPTHVCFVP